MSVVRGRPPGLAGGMNGSSSRYWSSLSAWPDPKSPTSTRSSSVHIEASQPESPPERRHHNRPALVKPTSTPFQNRLSDARAFEIDPGKLAEEARYDGLFVLRTNARITPLQAVLRYRDLMQVEQLFRTAKALMRTRPIYHASDAAIRGHVFCSFLALILRKELDERCRIVGFRPEWGDVLRDLDRLQEVAISKDGRQMTLRTPATGVIGPLFKAARIALPPNVRDASAT